MGWFDEQIKKRIQNDDEIMADAFARMANVISNQRLQMVFDSDRKHVERAVGGILRYYHIKAAELPENVKEIEEMLEFLMRPSGVMWRNVKLTKGWYKDAAGAMLGMTKDGEAVALIPGKLHGYTYRDPRTDAVIPITEKNAELLDEEAVCFYSPLPLREISITDLLKYLFGLLKVRDYLLMGGTALAATILGMITPVISQKLYGNVLLTGSEQLLTAFVMTLLLFGISQVMIEASGTIIRNSVKTRLDVSMESATMMRLLTLPADFFKQYGSGELAERVNALGQLCEVIFETLFSSALTALFSIVYIGQIFVYAPSLAVPAIVMSVLVLLFSLLTVVLQSRVNEKQLFCTSKESGLVYSLINGVAKLKNSGSEKRAFAKWAEAYEKTARYKYNPPVYLKVNTAVISAVTLFGTVILYYQALKAQMNVADYMAFNTAYALVNGAFTTLSAAAAQVGMVRPILKMIEPVMKAKPEISSGKSPVSRLSGAIELNNVSFRYNDTMPNVLDNLSLKIRPGQYVAIVGTTGCGKSTLMRILLGFEQPQKGAVYYDGKDLSAMDMKSLRRQMGVVMQNGKLFQGDIFSNITISAPQLKLEDAWEAAEMAGMADDIRHMPMGMNTIISEGGGGISGGQRQRLMIARAIAPKPRILMFDEATSALDNLTQKTVSESLDRLKCTRIVIAHRLSTIRHCDRIIVLDKGHIVEDGNYEELIARGGVFADLVERQRVDVNSRSA